MNIHSCPGGSSGKKSACNEGNAGRRCGFDPWIGKFPWKKKLQPTLAFFLENPMNREAWQALFSPGVKKSQTQLGNRAHIHEHACGNDGVLFYAYYTISDCSYNEQDWNTVKIKVITCTEDDTQHHFHSDIFLSLFWVWETGSNTSPYWLVRKVTRPRSAWSAVTNCSFLLHPTLLPMHPSSP